MLKYLYCKEVFSEIPSEISLGISITGCTIKCPGCHSRDLWIDNGIPLTTQHLDSLLKNHQGITCLLLLGGEHDIDSLTELFMYAHNKVKTAWYCGLDEIPEGHSGILEHLDYIKLGHFDKKLGGLDSPTTNQRLYKVYKPDGYEYGIACKDITSLFWHSSSSPS